ncbi:RagB/SusD family nutrient uptake outer membrane protein [uncultured Dokdonia sp.]|uniref:RagB/SusD family nutrient uptake outer membrane protein n=1 Tax=uncultured Dokdonia sp. TaxID=575653 RepID=UPI0030EE05F6|tara:strand:- start:320860 stop:322167 length:1308 start_codon:yes stop_codon:yes gene_type:complete
MKTYKKTIKYISYAMVIGFISACSIDEVVDPNRPSLGGVQIDANVGQLNELVVGVESSLRNGLGIETTASGTMARELYLFDADPRNTGDLLGKNGIALDNNSFYSTAQWNGNYRCIKNTNILIDAATNTEAITEEERQGYIGVAKTFAAYELIQIVKSYNVARIDVADEDNLGPVVSAEEALTAAKTMLDEAFTALNGSSFAFRLSEGFDGFNTPATFQDFNRAVAAMAAVYSGSGTEALDALTNSYFELNGTLTAGPKHIFSLSPGDQANPVFRAPDLNGDQIIVHNSWIEDAEDGDTRVTTKTAPRLDAQGQDDLNGTNETRLYASQLSSIDILRNEELILLYAEASILASNFDDAATALSIIRNSAGLIDYVGALTPDALTTELLKQRRYSLWSENARLYDVRRYNLENSLPIDRQGDLVFTELPIPLSENN